MTAPKLKRYGLKRKKNLNRTRRKQRRDREENRLYWVKSNVGYFGWDRSLKRYRRTQG